MIAWWTSFNFNYDSQIKLQNKRIIISEVKETAANNFRSVRRAVPNQPTFFFLVVDSIANAGEPDTIA